MRRLTRGRAATDDEAAPQATGASEPVGDAPADAPQGGTGVPGNGSVATRGEDAPTAVLSAGEVRAADARTGEQTAGPGETVIAAEPEGRDLPAGVDPGALTAAPTSAKRGRLRRRLRYLRAVREVLLRDLGGFYYEAQRTDEGPEAHRRLLDAKAARLTRLEDEVRELERRLEEERPLTPIRQPGLGGTCPQCGELHGSDARFCSRCGTPLGKTRAAAPRPAAAPASGAEPKATTASLWGRPKRPDPATADPTVAAPAATVAGEPAESQEPAERPDPADGEPSPPAGADLERAGGEPAQTGSERP